MPETLLTYGRRADMTDIPDPLDFADLVNLRIYPSDPRPSGWFTIGILAFTCVVAFLFIVGPFGR